MQTFSATEHERIFADALATATDHALSHEQARMALSEGLARLWQHAARTANVDPPSRDVAARSTEESERLRQLAIVRGAVARRSDGTDRDDE
jgi:hypothetical protein